jgi:hypothetical protein
MLTSVNLMFLIGCNLTLEDAVVLHEKTFIDGLTFKEFYRFRTNSILGS